MKTPQLLKDRLKSLGLSDETANKLANFIELCYIGKIKPDVDKVEILYAIINQNEPIDFAVLTVDRKKREISQEVKDKRFAEQLRKLQLKYNQNTETMGE